MYIINSFFQTGQVNIIKKQQLIYWIEKREKFKYIKLYSQKKNKKKSVVHTFTKIKKLKEVKISLLHFNSHLVKK